MIVGTAEFWAAIAAMSDEEFADFMYDSFIDDEPYYYDDYYI